MRKKKAKRSAKEAGSWSFTGKTAVGKAIGEFKIDVHTLVVPPEPTPKERAIAYIKASINIKEVAVLRYNALQSFNVELGAKDGGLHPNDAAKRRELENSVARCNEVLRVLETAP